MIHLIEKTFLVFIFIFIATILNLPDKAQAGDNKALLASMQKLLDEENQSRGKLDERLTSSIKDFQSINANQNNTSLLEDSLLRAESKISESRNALTENHLRIEFLNSFISMLETVSDVRAETPKILAELSHKELLASVESGSDSKVWLFDLYLSTAVRDVMEPSESYADFVKKFMNYSTLSEPHSPVGFMKAKERKYLTGPEKNKRTSPTQE